MDNSKHATACNCGGSGVNCTCGSSCNCGTKDSARPMAQKKHHCGCRGAGLGCTCGPNCQCGDAENQSSATENIAGGLGKMGQGMTEMSQDKATEGFNQAASGTKQLFGFK
ncbi:uncharacterized protein VTP21DRAFT_6022 [Calcarisporiella thermophila]|uniref:uncharacterized protein n=1 Tax=Calcarisporiella thermophila TaxID=911321 RepID=UPI0037430E23